MTIDAKGAGGKMHSARMNVVSLRTDGKAPCSSCEREIGGGTDGGHITVMADDKTRTMYDFCAKCLEDVLAEYRRLTATGPTPGRCGG